MTTFATAVSVAQDAVTLERGAVSVEISLRPFTFTVRRSGRRLLRNGGVWVADGVVRDHFIQLTEGVIPAEDLAPTEAAQRAEVTAQRDHGVELSLRLNGGRGARLVLSMPERDRLELVLQADGAPLRLALDWDRRSEERFVGLGARHCTEFDQRGRAVQLGADRRYTGPDCPTDMLSQGGIPQGDYAPVPWLCSSRGYSMLMASESNGIRFDMSGARTSVSTRAAAGPLHVNVMCQPTPAARLQALCRISGFPDVQPEWGYGFWKSRDVHEHQDDVFDDFDGFRRHDIPLDAIVIDSPWATQYNTWEFNPFQFPDAKGMIDRLRADAVRLVVWCTPWVNLDSRDGQIPPQPESEALHHRPAPNYAPGAAGGHFVKNAQGEPFVARWWMGTGSPVDFTSQAAEQWWREQVERIIRLGVEGIKADDGEGYYLPDDVVLADGRTGARARRPRGIAYRAADHPPALPQRPVRPAWVDAHRCLRIRARPVGRAGARRRRAHARGDAAARSLDRDVVRRAGQRRLRHRRPRADRADSGMGARRLDRGHLPGGPCRPWPR